MKRNSWIRLSFLCALLITTYLNPISFAQFSGRIVYEGHWPLTPHRIVKGAGEMIFCNSNSSLTPIGLYSNHLFKKGNSISFEDHNDMKHSEFRNIQHGDTSKMDYLSIRDPFNIYVDLERNTLLHLVKNTIASINIPVDTLVLLSEKTGEITWTLHNDIKLVGNYMCQKATTRFRGRDYEVWFAPEIPISFGPWKLNGLPGLILEVSDSSYQVYFHATSIMVDSERAVDVSIVNQKIPEYPMRDYQMKLWAKDREIERKGEEVGQRIQAKAPKGVIISFTTTVSIIGLELEYEFLPK